MKNFYVVMDKKIVYTITYMYGDDIEAKFKLWATSVGLTKRVTSLHSFKNAAYTNGLDRKDPRHALARLIPEAWTGLVRPVHERGSDSRGWAYLASNGAIVKRVRSNDVSEVLYGFCLAMAKKGYKPVHNLHSLEGVAYTNGNEVFLLVEQS